MAILCNRMGIDIWEVIDAAKTKPYGFMAFYPGPGLGGHCIPIDPWYLTWKAREYNYHTRLIEVAGEINNSMPEFVVERIGHILNEEKERKPINGSTIHLLGIAYKKDIDDFRESPVIKIMELLEIRGANVVFSDTRIPAFTYKGKNYEGVELSKENIQKSRYHGGIPGIVLPESADFHRSSHVFHQYTIRILRWEERSFAKKPCRPRYRYNDLLSYPGPSITGFSRRLHFIAYCRAGLVGGH